jgi:hypothetical protein
MRIAMLLSCASCTVQGPVVEPVDDQIAVVGRELRLELHADQPDLSWSFASSILGVEDRAAITARDGGGALFRFRPDARDVGAWVFDFRAEGGGGASIESAAIEVRPAPAAAPAFLRPLGAGTALDADCVELDVVVADADSPVVDVVQVEPLIAGAALVAAGPLAATWRWCPDAAQRAQDRFLLTLAADDGEHPPALLRYQLVLRGCLDDAGEEDDGPATERWLDLDQPAARTTGDRICPGDADWFGLGLFPGETLHVVARFPVDAAGAGDLDLRLDDDAGATVARAEAPGSDESLAFTSADGGAYHLVVHGWQDAANSYDLCAAVGAGTCP